MRLFRPFPLSLILASALLLPALAPLAAAEAVVVREGDTIQLGSVTYRLDGIDAPEMDQTCIDDHADPWACGVEARDALAKLIGGKPVRCEDLGIDKAAKKRHVAICSVDGQGTSLNQQMAQLGLAVSIEGSARARFVNDGAKAREAKQGLWKGCFAAPAEVRAGKKDGALLGAACRADRDREIRAVLFPEELQAPPGCSIKAKFAVRARVTGNVGLYHLQGCPSYAGTTQPDRWFCTEDDAQASGFRRAYNCRAPKPK